MREEPTLSHFMANASTVPQEGVASYDIKLTQTKKRNPQYSMAHAKQHTTFDFGKFLSYLLIEVSYRDRASIVKTGPRKAFHMRELDQEPSE